jgi:hypothetical protein
MIFAVTVDTEGDDQWNHGAPLTTRNVGYWEPFQATCEKHGVLPTYLITSEIAADPMAQTLLRAWVARGAAEVGAHLHPWTTPPFDDRPGFRFNDPDHAFLNELPDELVWQKLQALTQQIEDCIGVRPVSFRAGRFGLDMRAARALGRLGYIVDSSVTPLVAHNHEGLRNRPGGPDFRSHGLDPFVILGTDVLETPITILPTYALLRRFQGLLNVYRYFPVRAARKILFRRWLVPQPVWLCPKPEFTRRHLNSVWRISQDQGSPLAVMMLHSSELMPGGSPFRPTARSVQELLKLLDVFFGFVIESGAVPATLSSAAIRLRSSNQFEVRSL